MARHSPDMMIKITLGVAVLTALSGCSGAVVNVGSDAPDAGSSMADATAPLTGAKVNIHVRATEAAFPHADGLSSQTARNEKLGIAGLTLLTSASDPAPLTVFESAPVEAGLNDKEDTVVARVVAKTLKAGTYTIARVPVSHVRFTVAGTYHAGGVATAGEFNDIVVLTNATTIDGQVRNQGWYSSTFVVGGMTYGPTTGANSALPQTDAGSFKLVTAGGHAYYEFPVNLVIDPEITRDVDAIFEVNTNLDFRWQELPNAGYATGVFDVEMTSFEPVIKFSANSFRVFFE